VHELTILPVYALPPNLNFHVIDHVNTRVVDPPSISGITTRPLRAWRIARINLRQHHLKVGAVGKVAIARHRALHTAPEVSLSVESLFNRFHCEVGVAAVCYLPESDLWIPSQVYVLGSVSYKLH
jgi:hypothetical protein